MNAAAHQPHRWRQRSRGVLSARAGRGRDGGDSEVHRRHDQQEVRLAHTGELFGHEIVDSVGDLQHELIRECLKKLRIDGGIEITSISDIPSEGTGLGSSSSYTVSLLNALYAYTHRHVGAERLAREACEIEIDRCLKPI